MAALGATGASRLFAGLEPVHRRWLLINAIIIPAVINAGSSAAIARLSLAGEKRVPVWSVPLVDKPGLVTDTLGTFLILPFLTTLSIGIAVRAAQRAGRLPVPTLPASWAAEAAALPVAMLRRAWLFAAVVAGVLGPIAITALATSGFHDGVQASTFVIYKALLGVALGAVFTPFVALMAMAASD